MPTFEISTSNLHTIRLRLAHRGNCLFAFQIWERRSEEAAAGAAAAAAADAVAEKGKQNND